MSLPTSRLSYEDCYTVLDKCLEAERGIRVKMPDYDKAVYFRMRLHMARSIIRKENTSIYELGHPMYGCSQYDPIAVRIRIQEFVWVYLEKISAINLVIEEINDIPNIEYKPMLQITGPQEPEILPPIRRRL